MKKLLLAAGLLLSLGAPSCGGTEQGDSNPPVRLATYNKLVYNMSYKEAARLLDREGTAVSSNEIKGKRLAMYKWKQGFRAGIIILFQNDSLLSEQRSGLH